MSNRRRKAPLPSCQPTNNSNSMLLAHHGNSTADSSNNNNHINNTNSSHRSNNNSSTTSSISLLKDVNATTTTTTSSASCLNDVAAYRNGSDVVANILMKDIIPSLAAVRRDIDLHYKNKNRKNNDDNVNGDCEDADDDDDDNYSASNGHRNYRDKVNEDDDDDDNRGTVLRDDDNTNHNSLVVRRGPLGGGGGRHHHHHSADNCKPSARRKLTTTTTTINAATASTTITTSNSGSNTSTTITINKKPGNNNSGTTVTKCNNIAINSTINNNVNGNNRNGSNSTNSPMHLRTSTNNSTTSNSKIPTDHRKDDNYATRSSGSNTSSVGGVTITMTTSSSSSTLSPSGTSGAACSNTSTSGPQHAGTTTSGSGRNNPSTTTTNTTLSNHIMESNTTAAITNTSCLHCHTSSTDIQVRCDECGNFICETCHWCHEYQANHEIRVCDRCDAFYCRHCDEMDHCDDCGEVVCASCSTLLSCKFCGGGLCEECATACGRCGIVLCSRDVKFAVDCDTCRLAYCLVCLASGSKDPCIRCGHRPSKRMEQLVHLRLKSIYKAFKQSGANRAAAASASAVATTNNNHDNNNTANHNHHHHNHSSHHHHSHHHTGHPTVFKAANARERQNDDPDDAILVDDPETLLQAAAAAAAVVSAGKHHHNGRSNHHNNCNAGSSNESLSLLAGVHSQEDRADRLRKEKEKADAAAAALLAELEEEEEQAKSKKNKKKKKKDRQKIKPESEFIKEEEGEDEVIPDLLYDDKTQLVTLEHGTNNNTITVDRPTIDIDHVNYDEQHDLHIGSFNEGMNSLERQTPASDEKASSAVMDELELELDRLVRDSDADGLENLLCAIKGVPGRASLRKNVKKALKRLRCDEENEIPVVAPTEPPSIEENSMSVRSGAVTPEARGGTDHHVNSVSVSYSKPLSPTGAPKVINGARGQRTEYVINMAPYMVGWIIGKGGQRIRDLMEESGARIWIDQGTAGTQEPRLVHVSGHRKCVDTAVRLIKDLVGKAPPTATQPASQGTLQRDIGVTKDTNSKVGKSSQLTTLSDSFDPKQTGNVTGGSDRHQILDHEDSGRSKLTLSCDPRFVPLLIGRRGWTIKHIQDTSGARVDIDQTVNPRKITVSGTNESVQVGIKMVRDVLSYPQTQLHSYLEPIPATQDLQSNEPYCHDIDDSASSGNDQHRSKPIALNDAAPLIQAHDFEQNGGCHSSPPSSLIMATDAKDAISASSSLSSTPEPSTSSLIGNLALNALGSMLPQTEFGGQECFLAPLPTRSTGLPNSATVMNGYSLQTTRPTEFPHGQESYFTPLGETSVPLQHTARLAPELVHSIPRPSENFVERIPSTNQHAWPHISEGMRQSSDPSHFVPNHQHGQFASQLAGFPLPTHHLNPTTSLLNPFLVPQTASLDTEGLWGRRNETHASSQVMTTHLSNEHTFSHDAAVAFLRSSRDVDDQPIAGLVEAPRIYQSSLGLGDRHLRAPGPMPQPAGRDDSHMVDSLFGPSQITVADTSLLSGFQDLALSNESTGDTLWALGNVTKQDFDGLTSLAASQLLDDFGTSLTTGDQRLPHSRFAWSDSRNI